MNKKSLLDTKILVFFKKHNISKKHFKEFKEAILEDYSEETSNENKIAKRIDSKDMVEIFDASSFN